jgi:hypothetical protein
MSNSKPAINIMYKSPIVENSLIEPSDSIALIPIKPKPCGPIITPEMIRPIIAGIFIFLNKMGDSKMIKSNREKTNTGFLSGR